MSRFWNHRATAHRNWSAFFAAIGMAGILIWSLVLKNQEDSHQLLRTETVISTVTHVKEYSMGKMQTKYGETQGIKIYRGRIALPDGGEIEMRLVSPIPQVGDKMPIVIDHYDDGQKKYRINQMEWRLYH